MKIRNLLVACLCLSVLGASAQIEERIDDVLADPGVNLKNPEGRAHAVKRIKVIEDARALRTRAKAKALGMQMRIRKPSGGVREIVDFEGDRPVYLVTRNLNAAISTGANLVQTAPYALDGTGIIAGVWDAGSVRSTHQEFATGSRVIVMDGAAVDDHATHVGGTIGALGVSPTRKGMALNVFIHSYNWNSDTSEMTSRAATGPNQFADKIYLSNHSYGFADGWDGNVWIGNGTDQNSSDFSYGQYNSTARTLDGIMYNAPYYIAFWAAGNERSDNPGTGNPVTIGGVSVAYNPAIHPPGDGVYRNGFETISAHGIAKNLITMGAANDAVTSGLRDPSKSTLTSFSSTGPCDDGRIKPDLVANGAGLSSTGSSSDTAYTSKSGTSMSSPNATGSAVLVVDQYKRLFNSAMRASTLKGLLIHTATDIGNPGPDYKHGWGLIDTKQAVDLIIDHHANPGKSRIIEDQVSTTVTSRTYSFLWDGGSPLRATLSWTDPQGASTTAHDSRTPRLVNNINLKLIAPNGNEYFPFVMPFVGTWTVASMNENATTGVNNTDNVEQVLVQGPGQIGTWQAVVSYTGPLTNNSQNYGLLLSGTADVPNIVNIKSPDGGEIIYRGAPHSILWVSNLSGNVSIELLKGGAPYSVLSASEANDGSFTWQAADALPLAADYAIRISSVDDPSYSDTSSATFSIAINPWADPLDTTGIAWSSSGTLPWFSQATTTQDGVDAAQSGAIDHDQSTALGATITGPGTLSFWWKVSSESNYDFLRFFVNGVEQTGDLARISGNVNWIQKSVNIPAGPVNIEWAYTKDFSVDTGSDAAWVDQVVFGTPEIAVEQPVGTDLTDGGATVGFGAINLTTSAAPVTFTVRNIGTFNLTGLALSKSGSHSADFTLGALGSTTLVPGASTTFDVVFSPGSIGTRNATIHLASNDANENPFDIALTGTGITVGTLVVSPAGNLVSSGSFGGLFSPASLEFTLSNPGTTSLDWTAAKTAAWVDLNATGGTLAPGNSTTLIGTINDNAEFLAVGGYNDTVSFTNITNGNGNTTRGLVLNVNPIQATVTLGNLSHPFTNTPKSASVTTDPPGLAHTVTYNGSSTEPTNAGSYAVVATITAPNYSGSDAKTMVIEKAAQAINFAALDPALDNANPFHLTATASSGLAVAYGSSNPLVATVPGNTVTITGLGTTTITASQTGDTNYTAATPVPQTLTVVRANPLAMPGGPYKVLVGQSLSLNGSGSQPSYLETITTHEWDLNNDDDFNDATGATPAAINFATLTGTWGMFAGPNTIRLKVTDSSNKTSIVSTTVELVLALTWDANGMTAGQTNGAGAWLGTNLWWDGAANQTWASGSDATFGGPNTAGGAVTLASPTTVNSLTFNSFITTAYTLGTTGQKITLNSGITKNAGSFTATIVSPLSLAGPQTWTNNSSANLNVQAATTLSGVLTVGGTGITSFDNAGAVIGGSGGIIKNGTGHLILSGGATPLHAFTGDITVNGGSIGFQTSAFLAGRNVNLTNGYLGGRFGSGYTWTGGLGTGANQIQITGGTSGFSGEGSSGSTFQIGTALSTLQWGSPFFNPTVLLANGDARMNTNGRGSLNNGIDLNGANRTITSLQTTNGAADSGFTISGVISNSSGTAGMIKNGVGHLILPAANTYNGTTTINAGSIIISNAGSLGSAAGNTVIATGARVFAGSGMANKTTLEPFSIAGNGVAGLNGAIHIGNNAAGIGFGGAITLSANAKIQADGTTGSTFSGGIDLNANTLTYSVGSNANSTVQTLGISGVGGSLVKTDLGTLTLSAPGTYTGLTTISAGLLVVTHANALGGTSTGTLVTTGGLVIASGVTTNSGESITISSGAADFNGALRAGPGGGTWAGSVNLDASARIGASATHTLTITGNIGNGTGNTLAVSGESGTGVIVLNPTTGNTYTGSTSIIRGILRLGKTDALPTSTTLDVDSASNTAETVNFDMAGFNQTVAALQDTATTDINGKITNSVVGTSTLTVNQSTNTHFSGIIEDGGLNRLVALVKSNAGALTLAGSNTYTGSTTITSGTLTLGANNVLPNSSAISIGTATLDAVTFGDILGTLNAVGSAVINLGPGASLAFDDSSAVGGGVWAGTLNITGTFVSGSSLRFGTSATALTPAQLALISKPGGSPVALDSNGYLVNAPLLTLTGAPIAAVNTTYGSPSPTPTGFSVSGSGLSPASGNLTVGALPGFEFSTSAGGTYTPTLSLPYIGGAISNTAVFVRLAANAGVAGSPYSGNISVSGGGAAPTSIATIPSIINKATPVVTVTVDSYTYNGNPQGPTSYATNPIGHTGTPTWSYEGSGETTYPTSITPPTAAGTYTASVTIATDSNFEAASSIATAFTIARATPTVTVTAGSYTYNGSAQGPTAYTTSPVGNTGTATWIYEGVGETTYPASASPPTDAGTYTATVSITADANFDAASSSATAFTIGKANPAVTVTVGSYTYTGSAQGPTAYTTNPTGNTNTPTWSYEGTGDTTYPASATPPTDAGTYTATVALTTDTNFDAASSIATAFTIGKASPAVTVTVGRYTYTGSAQGPTAFTTSPVGNTGTPTWIYEGTGETTYPASTTPPTDVGTYTASVTLSTDSNFEAASSSATDFTITKATPTLTVTAGSYTYNGSAQGPTAYTTSPNGNTGTATWIYEGVGETTYPASASPPIDAGTYNAMVSITADTNFDAASSIATAFTIGKANPAVTVTVGSYTYTGSAQGPTAYTTNPTGNAGAPTWSYEGAGATTYPASVTLPTKAGTYTATVMLAADFNFEAASSSATAFTIEYGNAYEAWSDGVAFDDDANGDGVENGLAWLLGAVDNSQNALGKLPVVTHDSGKLTFKFRYLKAANRNSALLHVEYSRDLGDTDPWHEAAVPDADGTVNNVIFDITDDGDFMNVEATIPATAASPGTALFGRLKATNTP